MTAPRDYPILVASLGQHQVSATNPKIGTVLVTRQAYARFRGIVGKRGVISDDDKQSDAICELTECFEAAMRLPNRDGHGNILLLDKDTDLMFVVEDARRLLIGVFAPRERRKKSRGKKRPAQIET